MKIVAKYSQLGNNSSESFFVIIDSEVAEICGQSASDVQEFALRHAEFIRDAVRSNPGEIVQFTGGSIPKINQVLRGIAWEAVRAQVMRQDAEAQDGTVISYYPNMRRSSGDEGHYVFGY